MAALTTAKARITAKYQRHDKDTGSSEVQISIISARIEVLTEHMSRNRKDFHSLRGLLKLVNKRKSLVNYLKQHRPAALAEVMGDK